VQTIPGKGWFMILRLYGTLEPWFNKTWRPGEFELVPRRRWLAAAAARRQRWPGSAQDGSTEAVSAPCCPLP
jgi:hypothetical protein